MVDYSGDTVVAQANIGPGPSAFTLDESGSTGYTINSDGTMTDFPASSNLQTKNVNYLSLPSDANPVNLFSPSSGLWAADLCGTSSVSSVCQPVADVYTGSPLTFNKTIPVAVTTPVSIVGPGAVGQRDFVINQNIPSSTGVECNISPSTVDVNGQVDTLEVASYTVSGIIPVGVCPVYAVESSDSRRLFVLNRGSDTITVINSQLDTLDSCAPFTDPNTGRTVTCHPSLPLSTKAGLTGTNVPTTAGPVYAEYNSATNQLVVADYDGNAISIIDVTLDEYGNDGPTFGATYTVPVGKNPASVTVLYDGSRAYTANQTDSTVSVVEMSSGVHVLEKTLEVTGHPRTVVSTQNSTSGKVYVASPDSPYLTIIRTDLDLVDTSVLVTGNIVDVRVTTQNGVSTNNNNVSRVPGFGQPCNTAGLETSKGSSLTLAECQVLP
jgi:DNA-binding beta-propeller fold protein YncE